MRVLVTGYAGYLGPVVVRQLHEAGHYVIGLDTGWFLPNYAEPPDVPDMALFRDTRNVVGSWNNDADAIVHLAGLSNDPMGALDEDLTHDINVASTLRLGLGFGGRQVVASSCSVYGQHPMATEETLVAPLTAYARGKAVVDKGLKDTAACLRFGTLYGYSPGHRLDLVVNRMTYDAVHEGRITVTGNAMRPLTHVEDAAAAIVFMVERDDVGIYNVVGGNSRVKDVAQDVADAMWYSADTEVKFDYRDNGGDLRDYAADGSKIRQLGFSPSHALVPSLPELIRKSRDLPGPRERYERLSALQRLQTIGYLDASLRRPTKESVAA